MEKKTKIVATIGPASNSKKILEKLITEGIDVARINFSHGTHEANGKLIDAIRDISDKIEKPVGIIADLQGPRIRTLVEKDTEIKKGETLRIGDVSLKITKTGIKNIKTINLDWPGITKSINTGNEILIEDGLIRIKIIGKEKKYLRGEVMAGGTVKNHKGVNIPDANLQIGAVTKKDEEDLKFALEKNVDFIALSFVGNSKDVENTRKKIIRELGRKKDIPQIISKIERKEAIKNIDELIMSSDIIMVARGDLGIELPEAQVVIYQKEIIGKCIRSGRPVIVATQMLNSMIENPLPTRAEVSDVSNAVIDHTDAVMLSGETANGKYPVESVHTMHDIISRTEGSPFDFLPPGFLGDAKSSISAAVAQSAHNLAKDSGAKAIVVASISGFTARMIARHRPDQPIYVITNSEKTHNQLSILWGSSSFILSDCKTLDDLITRSINMLVRKKILRKKDKVIIVTGRPHVKREHMSLVKVEEVK